MTSSAFTKPVNLLSDDTRVLHSLVFRKSSRIKALETNSSKSIGASCNTFAVEDNICDTEASITEAHSWAYAVLAYQGAPAIDFSNLRGRDSDLGSGGKASGAVSFMRPFDAIVATMRREEKKNGAGLAALDYLHPDLDEFLDADFQAAYKAVYLPMHNTLEADAFLANYALVEKLSKAYDAGKCFLVKRPLPVDDVPLFINLCTEIEIPHKGYCVLGAINLGQFDMSNLHHLSMYFCLGVRQLKQAMDKAAYAASQTKLYCFSLLNSQFGLGVYGLASLLGNIGVTYEEFNESLDRALYYVSSITQAASAAKLVEQKSKANYLVSQLLTAYADATDYVCPMNVRAAFCIQPTVSTARNSIDINGYHVSPEIQPVIGLKHADAVTTLIKSEIKGDILIHYAPNTPTIDEVPYHVYAKTSHLWQQLMNLTGYAHRHSHCFYGEKFTVDDMYDFYLDDARLNERRSLYYRLPWTQNVDSLRKDTLWQTVDNGELWHGDIEQEFAKFCTMDMSTDCDCSM